MTPDLDAADVLGEHVTWLYDVTSPSEAPLDLREAEQEHLRDSLDRADWPRHWRGWRR